MHFLNVFFSLPVGGVPRSVSKICLSNCCFSIVVLQLCVANVFCDCVLQSCVAIVCCNCVLQSCFAIVFCNCVLQMCSAIPRSPNSCKAQEALTVVKAQEVLTDVKSNNS